MSKNKVNTLSKNRSKSKNGETPWDKAILDAAQILRQTEAKASELRRAISTFEEMRDAGEPWPGTVEASAVKSKTEKPRRLHQE